MLKFSFGIQFKDIERKNTLKNLNSIKRTKTGVATRRQYTLKSPVNNQRESNVDCKTTNNKSASSFKTENLTSEESVSSGAKIIIEENHEESMESSSIQTTDSEVVEVMNA